MTVNDTSRDADLGRLRRRVQRDGLERPPACSAPADRDRAIKLLFDATDGAHFVFGRIPIGASDYAIDRYTLDETANDTAWRTSRSPAT